MIYSSILNRGRALVVAGVLSLTIMSCASLRANSLLLMQTSDREKAELLFSDGLERYNGDLLKNNDLTQIDVVRRRFSDALKLDPDHPRAAKYVIEVDKFRDKQYAYWLSQAKTLLGTAKRTANQDYELVLAVKKLNDLVFFDKEVSGFSKEIKELRARVIEDMENRVQKSDTLMETDSSHAAGLKNIKDTEYLALTLQRIDPANRIARQALKHATLLREELTAVAGVAPSASTAVKKAASTTAKPKTASSAKPKPSATAKVTKPAPTAEKPKARDYDAEIASILTSVDERINKNDPAGAREVISSYLPLLVKQANKTKLSAKDAAIKTLAERLYKEGIDFYNQEDYEGAQINFSAVVRWDSKYKDAREYLDRSNAKIRALSGR